MVSEGSGALARESLDAYDYELPGELIAQEPAPRRDESRLLVLDRRTGSRRHQRFRDVIEHFRPGDLLVLNETRVFPARLRGRRKTGGRVEVLLLEERAGGPAWTALARPARSLRPHEDVEIEPGPLAGGACVHVVGREGERMVVEMHRGSRALSKDEVFELCEAVGETPLPPYIRRAADARKSPADRERYQTVYARRPGAAAAPTAGLHFTEGLIAEGRRAGVRVARVTLHVGLGTFQPLTDEAFARPVLHEEQVEVDEEAGSEILKARAEGRRVIAVGTTSVRAVESFVASGLLPFRERTDLFIKPGYTFRGVDALVTNFHLPRSSLLVLLCAFAGRDLVLDAYREAVRERYRFYSYGDAMLVV